ncbi:hypothetical protein [Streptosporangium sp. NPDC003464]
MTGDGHLVPRFRRGPHGAREAERRNPRPARAERASSGKHYRRIPVRRHRVLHRLINAVPALRNMGHTYRFTFG